MCKSAATGRSPGGDRCRHAGHQLWFGHVVPWLGARMSEPAAYRYLAASTAYLPGAEELAAVVERAGFEGVGLSALMWGAVKMLIATRP